MMIKAALSGQPASGVGAEIQQKREKMRMIYKTGRRQQSSTQYRSMTASLYAKTPANISSATVMPPLAYSKDIDFSVQGNRVRQ